MLSPHYQDDDFRRQAIGDLENHTSHFNVLVKNQRAHSPKELKEAEGSLPSPRVLVQAELQKDNVNTQFEATGHTNLFSNLFYFSSKHFCRQTVQENKPHFGYTQSSSISKSSEYCDRVALFPVLPVCSDALNGNKID